MSCDNLSYETLLVKVIKRSLLLLLICIDLNAQEKIILEPDFSTLYSSFERVIESSSGVDTVRGDIYFMSLNKVYLDIIYPLHQIMTIEGKITRIYYPELQRAFLLESENPALVPVVPGLLGALRPDYGLSEFGFEIKGQSLEGDTLITHWFHPKAKDKIGQFKLAQLNDRLVYAQYESLDSFSQTKTSFANYVSVEGMFFPTVMVTEINTLQEDAKETMTLTNLKVNLQIPSNIRNFKIPEHVPVEKRKW